jgi:hypothetical protein
MSEYDKIRQRIEKRMKKREEVIQHGVAFVLVNAMMWGIYVFSGGLAEGSFPWPIFVTFGWGIGMVTHYLEYYNKYGMGAERREDQIEREVEREMARRGYYEKAKNDDPVRLELTEDGEIEEVYDEGSGERRQRE